MIIATEGITSDFLDAFIAYLVRLVVSRMNTDISLKSNMIMFYRNANLFTKNKEHSLKVLGLR